MSVTLSKRPRAIFFGTPEFAVPCLEALLDVADVALVVTQPDRPSGRGMRLHAPPVKALAQARQLQVVQPTRIRTASFEAQLRELDADVGVVVAYGRILPRGVLEAPRLGCVNVHASLLPRLRGAAPINWAIARGDAVTGVCLMQMDEGMDTGPVLACRETAIDSDETAGALSVRLGGLGAALLAEALPAFLAGALEPQAQDESRATHAPMLKKQDGAVDWTKPARQVFDRFRGMTPWPGAFSSLNGKRVKLHRLRVVTDTGVRAAPGTVLRADAHGIDVACGDGSVAIEALQPEGKRTMQVAEFLAGHPLPEASRLG